MTMFRAGNALVRLLRQWGMVPMEAAGGDAALTGLEADSPFAAVMIDAVMPGMDGFALASGDPRPAAPAPSFRSC